MYRVSGPGDWSLVATVAAEQVTGLARGDGETTALVTANPARVYALGGTREAEGTFVSTVKDAETAAAWGQASWEGSFPAHTSVQLQTRSGNTAHPDATWSDWSAPLTHAAGEPIHSERARFMQLRVKLAGQDGATPTVESLSAAYLQRNLPPEVKAITVHPPGEVFQKPISVSGDPEVLGFEPDPAADRPASARGAAANPPAITFSRKMYQRGMRTFSWQADDPNDDPLLFDVLYRAVGDERWRPLRRGLSEPVLAWDTSTVPNGRYVLRVSASDAPGNPPDLALTGTKDSTSFEVDNTPPTIAASLDSSHKDLLRATARDDSPIRRLEMSVDASRWEEIRPKDGISDSREEQYEIRLPPSTTGRRAHRHPARERRPRQRLDRARRRPLSAAGRERAPGARRRARGRAAAPARRVRAAARGPRRAARRAGLRRGRARRARASRRSIGSGRGTDPTSRPCWPATRARALSLALRYAAPTPSSPTRAARPSSTALRAVTRRLLAHDPSPPDAGSHASHWLAEAPASSSTSRPRLTRPRWVSRTTSTQPRRSFLARLPRPFSRSTPAAARPRRTGRPSASSRSRTVLDETGPCCSSLGPAENASFDPIASHRAHWVVARELPRRVLGAVLSRAALFVGNDSGASHLAAAAGAPTLALFGPTNPALWAPLGPRVRCVRAPADAWTRSTSTPCARPQPRSWPEGSAGRPLAPV